jgi:hypothetical protein
VNAIATIYVNQHLDSLRAEKRQARMASRTPARSLRSRLASAAASLGIGSPAGEPLVPTLHNHPYGG